VLAERNEMTVPLEDPVGWQVHFEDKPATQRDRVGCVLYSTLPRKTTWAAP